MSDFGETLRELREKRGLTVNQLGIYSEVSPALISKIENKKRGVPKPDTLEKLARGLKMDYKELMHIAGYIEEKPDEPENQEEAIQDLIDYLMDPNTTIDGDPLPPELRDDLLSYVRVFQATKNKKGNGNL